MPKGPRINSKRSRNKQAQVESKSPPNFFERQLDILNNLHWSHKVGIFFTCACLVSSVLILRSKKADDEDGLIRRGTTKGNGRTLTKGSTIGEVALRRSKSSKEKVPTEEVYALFQNCMQQHPPQKRKKIMDMFYDEVVHWKPKQLEIKAQTLVVSFLIQYYRLQNQHNLDPKFSSDQADHVRLWSSYKCTPAVAWSFYNVKFEFLYSAAWLQKSIPHLRQFYKWVLAEPLRPVPIESEGTVKDNYNIITLQTGCVLGDWDKVRQVGKHIEAEVERLKDKKKGDSPISASDPFSTWSIYALEMPEFKPNFTAVYRLVDKISEIECFAPPKFGEWQIRSMKYKAQDSDVTMPEMRQYVLANEKSLDSEGYVVFVPSNTVRGYPKTIQLWGHIAQMSGPMWGNAGFFPMAGGWTDTRLLLESSYSYRGRDNKLMEKKGVLDMERQPEEEEVKWVGPFGKEETHSGYVWTGTLTVTLKLLKTIGYGPRMESRNEISNSEGDHAGNLTDSTTQVFDVVMVLSADDKKEDKHSFF